MGTERQADTRRQILLAAEKLLAEGGPTALSTRAVSAAAGIQAPTLYRLFGDKDGLLDALAQFGFARYLSTKQALPDTGDPVDNLRHGWDAHIEFGLTHPGFYRLLYGGDRIQADADSEAGDGPAESRAILRRLITRIAEAGRLRLPVDTAVSITSASGVGVTLYLLSQPAERRDMAVARQTREAMLAAITTDPPAGDRDPVAARAAELAAVLDGHQTRLTAPETALLREWLRRLAE